MKIAVTSKGTTPDSKVDPRFGRAAAIILFDTDSDLYEAIDPSQNLDMSQGAGIQAARAVARLGANCLLTGHCGPQAFKTLSAAGVKVYTGVKGKVTETIEAFARIEGTTIVENPGNLVTREIEKLREEICTTIPQALKETFPGRSPG